MVNPFNPLNFMPLLLLGVALHWALHLIYGGRRRKADDAMLLVLTIAAWLLVLVGLLAPIAGLTILGVPAVLIALVVIAVVVGKYRFNERRSLLWTLAVSAERGLPLHEAARAFATDRTDEVGRAAMELADLLQAGVPLPEALARSGHRLPADAELAARLGCEAPALAGVMKEAAREGGRFEPIWRPLYDRLLYFGLLGRRRGEHRHVRDGQGHPHVSADFRRFRYATPHDDVTDD